MHRLPCHTAISMGLVLGHGCAQWFSCSTCFLRGVVYGLCDLGVLQGWAFDQ
jgi:hypothetical protein